MAKVVKTAEKIANEEKMGLMAATVKEKVFATSTAVEINGDTQMADAKTA